MHRRGTPMKEHGHARTMRPHERCDLPLLGYACCPRRPRFPPLQRRYQQQGTRHHSTMKRSKLGSPLRYGQVTLSLHVRIVFQSHDTPRVCIPNVWPRAETDCHTVGTAPIHEVEVVVVHESWGIEHSFRQVWRSSLLRASGTRTRSASAAVSCGRAVEEIIALGI